MWNVKYMIITVITGATGIVAKCLNKSLKAVRGKPSTHSLQKTTAGLLRMSHTTLEVLQSTTSNLSGERPLLFQEEEYQQQKACDKRQQNNNSLCMGIL